jgi:hypothetical protein
MTTMTPFAATGFERTGTDPAIDRINEMIVPEAGFDHQFSQ